MFGEKGTKEMNGDVDEWVLFRTYSNIHEASFYRSVLEGSGVECFLPDENIAGMRPELSLMIGGVRMLVRKSDLRRAEDVLASEGKGVTGPRRIDDDE